MPEIKALIYREMPATWDPQFRGRFYARWGRENAIILARTGRVQYPEYHQLLSIKAAFGGEETYLVDRRRVTVDDDTFLVLNGGRRYGSLIESGRPMTSFSIFFEPRLAGNVLRTLQQPVELLLENHEDEASGTVEFAEVVRPHDRSVTPVLKYIRSVIAKGEVDDVWVEEQLGFLLQRMLRLHYRTQDVLERIPSLKRATRRELLRRAGLGFDYIHAHYRDPIGLREIASAARMSRFHFLRTFQAVYGTTPFGCLNGKRTQAAIRLLRTSGWSMLSIAHHVGFGSRTTLFRQVRAMTGLSPAQIRAQSVET